MKYKKVQKVVTNLKPGKACGLDNVLAEMLKAGGQEVILFMTKLFSAIFQLKCVLLPPKGNILLSKFTL